MTIETLFSLFVIPLIAWRFDYCVISAGFLTASAYWLQYISQESITISKDVVSISNCIIDSEFNC
jgi:hypothetical protein